MASTSISLIEACRQAAEIIAEARQIGPLYERAVRTIGEGELMNGILNLATEAIQDETLRNEVLVSNESVLSFLCGVWIQYLLVEIAGVKKEKLRSLAEQVFMDTQKGVLLH